MPAPPPPPTGLCNLCAHQRVVRTGRGSVFSMCGRHRDDPAYPKYPRLPVTACRGHEPAPDAQPARDAPGP